MTAATGKRRPWIPELHPRDAKGRFIKRGGQRSSSWAREVSHRANPAVRGARPRPGELPHGAASIHELMDKTDGILDGMEAAQVHEYLDRVLGFTDSRTGYTLSVVGVASKGINDPQVSEMAMDVDLKVVDRDGRRVGTATRTWTWDQNGTPVVHHEYLKMHKSAQGGGFAARMNHQAEAVYRANGVKEIKLTADIDVGGYAWAKQGYDFGDQHSMLAIAGMVRGYLSQGGLRGPADANARERFKSLVARSTPEHWGAGTAPIPLEWAMVDWTEGAETWPGKRMMLGTMWTGVKRL